MSEDHKTNDDENCTTPGQLPREVLTKYVLEQDEHEAKDIRNYVEGQAQDETVIHLELVKVEYALREKFEIWDVTTDERKWWVLTNATNLYSQEHFPSLDYLLSFHIGLMARLKERSLAEPSRMQSQFGEIERRQSEIHEAFDRATEAVDFQNIGLQIRETLLTLVVALGDFVVLPDGAEIPKKRRL